jgi:uncharacterized membrane protein YbhN (UPF0104 family)
VLVFYLLFRKLNIRHALGNLGLISLPLLGLNILMGLVLIQFSTVLRLKFFLDHNRIKVTFCQLLRYHFISLFFQNLLPSSLGSDAVKIYYLRNTSKLGRLSVIVLFSRFIGIFTMGIIALFSLYVFVDRVNGRDILINNGHLPLLLIILSLLILILLFIKPFTWLHHRTKGRIKPLKYLVSLESVYGRDTLAWALLFSLIIQFTSIFGTYLYYVGIGIPLDLKKCLIYIPAALLIAFVIPSINGMGVREYFLYSFFSKEVVSVENMFLISLQITIALLFTALIGWIVYFFKKRKTRQETAQEK